MDTDARLDSTGTRFAQAGADEHGGPVIDFLTLEEAARELGTAAQGVVLLAQQAGIPLRRLERAGRTLSGLSRAEVAGLRGELEAPAATEAERDLRQRLLAAERALEEASTDRELAREACQRLARANERSEALEARLAELAGELETARAETVRRDADQRAAEERTELLRADALERERALRLKLAEQTERTGEVERALAARRERVRNLARELRAARELEAANGRFADQLERKLDAASNTIAHLRRRPA